jgi:hypothetical protein
VLRAAGRQRGRGPARAAPRRTLQQQQQQQEGGRQTSKGLIGEEQGNTRVNRGAECQLSSASGCQPQPGKLCLASCQHNAAVQRYSSNSPALAARLPPCSLYIATVAVRASGSTSGCSSAPSASASAAAERTSAGSGSGRGRGRGRDRGRGGTGHPAAQQQVMHVRCLPLQAGSPSATQLHASGDSACAPLPLTAATRPAS